LPVPEPPAEQPKVMVPEELLIDCLARVRVAWAIRVTGAEVKVS
jgi:hypothetical protein